MQDGAGQDQPGDAKAELRQAQRHLKWLLIEHEHNLEALQRVRRQRARLRDQVEDLAAALAESRSAAYWAARESAGKGGLFARSAPHDPEADLVREVEDAAGFDGGWYLRQHPKAVRSGLSPALHYVRRGNDKGLDPMPGFSTATYLVRHPEAAEQGVPALVHAVRHGNLEAGTTTGTTTAGEVEASPADDVHL